MIEQPIPMILASASPRRTELLTQAGFQFQVKPSSIEETIPSGTPEQIVEDLAFQKASDIYEQTKKEIPNGDFMIIGADTIVFYDGEILGKPADENEAFDMLKLLADRTHQVYTGVAIITRKQGAKQTVLIHEKTDVTFYPITDFEIKEYIATKDPLDKAGAYGIQGPFAIHIKEIQGDYNNVVGLPIAKLYQTLKH